MKSNLLALLLGSSMVACTNYQTGISSVDPVNWEKRTVQTAPSGTFETGSTYLSIYPQIYSLSEHKTHDLTVTVSMRNTSETDTVYVDKAEYFDTKGNSIRSYFPQSIFLAPMETVAIVKDEKDQEGGTGANFLFHWKIKPGTNEPLFEGIMISTSGQQGLSFATQGKRIK